MHPPSSTSPLLNHLLRPLEHSRPPNGPNDFYPIPKYASLGVAPKFLALKELFNKYPPYIILLQKTMHPAIHSIGYFSRMFSTWYMATIDASRLSGDRMPSGTLTVSGFWHSHVLLAFFWLETYATFWVESIFSISILLFEIEIIFGFIWWI